MEWMDNRSHGPLVLCRPITHIFGLNPSHDFSIVMTRGESQQQHYCPGQPPPWTGQFHASWTVFLHVWRFLIASVISSIQRDMQSAEAASSCGVLAAYVLPEFRRRASRWNWFDSMVMQLFELAMRCWKRMARPDLLNWRIKRCCESGS